MDSWCGVVSYVQNQPQKKEKERVWFDSMLCVAECCEVLWCGVCQEGAREEEEEEEEEEGEEEEDGL